MIHSGIVLALFVPFVTLGWVPPVNPDPQQILNEAREDAQAGRYEEALAKHVWFHQNALKYQPSLRGVRLSFALDDWIRLSAFYPQAMEKLKEIRGEARTDVLRGKDLRASFHDMSSINRYLREVNDTKEVFVALDKDHPEWARQVYGLAQPALVQFKAYEICGKYLEPDTAFERILATFRANMQMLNDPRFQTRSPELREFGEKLFATDSATLVALLALNHRTKDAQRIADKAKQSWSNEAFETTLAKALEGEIPSAFPARF